MIAQSQKEIIALSSGSLKAKTMSVLVFINHVMTVTKTTCLTGPGLDGTSSCSTSNTSHGQMETLVPISGHNAEFPPCTCSITRL